MARRYQIIAGALEEAGYGWYEVSNWAKPGGKCRHNLIYWRDGDWWGAGPGAHSHLGNTRFFNVKHPARYSHLLSDAALPIAGEETLNDADRHTEAIMLGLRLAEGIPRDWVSQAADEVVGWHRQRGLLAEADGRLKVTDSGRLLADGIITDILVAEDRG